MASSGYFKEYYQKNKEKRVKQAIEYQKKNRAKRNEYMRKYIKKNRDRILELRRANADQRNARRREQYKADPLMRQQYQQYAKQWQEKNPERRFAQRLKPYGLTPEQYRDILSRQNGGCAICGIERSRDKSRRSKSGTRGLHIDHCHTSGKVRGLLCSDCNLALGKFRDDSGRIERALLYLRAFEREQNPTF